MEAMGVEYGFETPADSSLLSRASMACIEVPEIHDGHGG